MSAEYTQNLKATSNPFSLIGESKENRQFDATGLTPLALEKKLSEFNERIIETARVPFNSLSEDLERNECALVYTGSDGRCEKFSADASPIELILILKERNEKHHEIIQKIQKIIENHPHIFYKKFEIKYLEAEDRVSIFDNFNSGERPVPFPTRAFDAKFFIGREDVYAEYKSKFFREMLVASLRTHGRFKKATVNNAMALLSKTLESKVVDHISFSSAELHYDGGSRKGVKYPFLRPMQYQIADTIFQLIKEKKIHEEEMSQIPPSIIGRVHWLAEKKLIKISDEILVDVTQAYMKALVWSEQSYRAFVTDKQTVLKVPESELKFVASTIHQFCQSKIR